MIAQVIRREKLDDVRPGVPGRHDLAGCHGSGNGDHPQLPGQAYHVDIRIGGKNEFRTGLPGSAYLPAGQNRAGSQAERVSHRVADLLNAAGIVCRRILRLLVKGHFQQFDAAPNQSLGHPSDLLNWNSPENYDQFFVQQQTFDFFMIHSAFLIQTVCLPAP